MKRSKMKWATTIGIAVIVGSILMSKAGTHSPATAPAHSRGRQDGNMSESAEVYYKYIFMGTLFEERNGPLSSRRYLKDIVSLVGDVGPTHAMPYGGLEIFRDAGLMEVVIEEPDVNVVGRRYLIMKGRIGGTKDHSPMQFVRVIDCDQTVAEACLRARFRSVTEESSLPPLQVENADEEELKKWIAKVQERVERGGVSVEDVAGTLGEPTRLYYDPNSPSKANARYLMRWNKKLLRVERDSCSEVYSCPMLEFAVDGDKVTKASYDIYQVRRVEGSKVVF